jgi:protein-export membrane protein SecD
MLKFSKLKILSIIFFSFLAIYYALPSLINSEKNQYLAKFLPNQKLNLGLDLKGGSQLVLEVDFNYYLKEQIANFKDVLLEQIEDKNITVFAQNNDEKITLKITDAEKNKEVKKILSKYSDKIDFVVRESEFEINFSASEILQMKQNLIKQSIEIIRRRIDETGTKEPTIQAQGNNRILLQIAGVSNPEETKSLLGKTAKMTFHFVADDFEDKGFNSEITQIPDDSNRYYPIYNKVILSGDLLVDANATFHEGQPAVSFKFNQTGSKKFAEITTNNVGKLFAIILDNKVITAPRINTPINQGTGVISGNFTTEEANEVALLLRAGALLAPLKVIEERTIGASLGSDSIKSGAVAAVFGVIFVAIFMIIFYGLFGFFANIGMIVNIAFIIAILSLFSATLTLPGIAGIVLTMGMAVDSNVLIFERIKEELRIKKSVYQAIDRGFSEAFRTIIDANITTLIVAFFLFIFGSGPVKGFAITLSIGILSSMFTAILLTRMIIAIWLKAKKPSKINLI